MTGGVPDEVAAVRAFIRDRRSSRHRPSALEWYVLGFAGVLAAAMAAGPVGRFVTTVGAAGSSDVVRWLAVLAAVGFGAYAALLSIGPVVLSPARARWLLLSPLDRRALLIRPVLVVVVVCLVAGAVAGAATAAVLGAVAHLFVAAAAGASVAVAGVAVAVIAQPMQTAAALLHDLAQGGMLLAVVAVVAASAVPSSIVDASLLPAGTIACGLCAAALAVISWQRLARFPASAISDAVRLTADRIDAVIALEPRHLLQIGDRRYWRGRRLRSRAWPRLPAPLAVAWQEWRTLRRRPARIVLLATSAALPVALAGTTPGSVPPGSVPPGVLAAVLVGGTAAALAAVAGVRHDSDNPATGRWFAVSPGAVLAARSILPTVLSAAWTSAVLAALYHVDALGNGSWWLLGPALAPALATAAMRMARRGPIAHTSTPIVFPMTGTWMPSGWIIWIYSGVDLALIGTAPTLWTMVTQGAPTTVLVAAQAAAAVATLAAYLTAAAPSTDPPCR